MSTQQTDKMGNVTLTIDEHELHLFLCTAYQMIARELGVDDEDWLERVVIVPEHSGDGYCTPALQNKWGDHMNNLLKTIRTLDCELHDDLEYTCG